MVVICFFLKEQICYEDVSLVVFIHSVYKTHVLTLATYISRKFIL